MNLVVMLFALICGAVLQAVTPAWPLFGQAKAPILLAFVLYYALARTRGQLLQAAILAGILQDGLGMIPFGYSSFAFCMAGLAVSRFKDVVFVYQYVTHVLFGALSAFGVTLMMYILLASTNQLSLVGGSMALKLAGSFVLGGVLTPIVFKVGATLDGLVGNIDERASLWH